MSKICQQCEINEAEYKMLDAIGCKKCWKEYFMDNELYEEQSFQEFIDGLEKVE